VGFFFLFLGKTRKIGKVFFLGSAIPICNETYLAGEELSGCGKPSGLHKFHNVSVRIKDLANLATKARPAAAELEGKAQNSVSFVARVMCVNKSISSPWGRSAGTRTLWLVIYCLGPERQIASSRWLSESRESEAVSREECEDGVGNNHGWVSDCHATVLAGWRGLISEVVSDTVIEPPG